MRAIMCLLEKFRNVDAVCTEPKFKKKGKKKISNRKYVQSYSRLYDFCLEMYLESEILTP